MPRAVAISRVVVAEKPCRQNSAAAVSNNRSVVERSGRGDKFCSMSCFDAKLTDSIIHVRQDGAEIFEYPKCKDGRIVADVVRIGKGHTEGLDPHVTEQLVKLMLSAKSDRAASVV
jgi:hypothetical protein